LLGNFSREEVSKLFRLRTEETGQNIDDDALDYVWEQSLGQPWIVNSLFMRATMRILEAGDYSTVTKVHIEEAREQMILARETHLDSLAVRLKEPEIRAMMETLLSGGLDLNLAGSETFRICTDLGLVRMEKGVPSIANPMYREVLARHITFGPQAMIPEPDWQWEKADGSLDMDALMREFQVFWRENSEVWEEKTDYTEAFPHLLLMAFLQRVLNGGGRIEREYAAGRGRMDLFVEYRGKSSIIEIKLVHEKQNPATIKEQGLRQIAAYRNSKSPAAPSYLVIFDRRAQTRQQAWEERIGWETENDITVISC
jgi:hypothetical protein